MEHEDPPGLEAARAAAEKALADIRRAREASDPDLPQLIVALAAADDPEIQGLRPGAPTLDAFVAETRGRAWKRLSQQEKERVRKERLRMLLEEGAEVPPPPRLALDGVLLELWNTNGPYERACLLAVVRSVPLRWGPWRALKRIYKEAEARGDIEMLGAMTARLDQVFAQGKQHGTEVGRATLAYMVRRAWRALRLLGQGLPAAYPDAAAQVLRFYEEETNWSNTWVANHIFYHETGDYTRRRFAFRQRPSTLQKYRAFGESWTRTPRPLFLLLETARSEQARRFATTALRSDFRTALREVEPAWVARLLSVESATVHDFVIWLLGEVPRFEQGALRDLGLHEAVLRLFDSPSQDARAWAAGYARTHARDLSTDALVRLANNDNEAVRKLARDLLLDRDPRKDVGLDAWGRLLGTSHAHELAANAIRKHFGAAELTPAWFKERLLSGNNQTVDFASQLLQKLHPATRLGVGFYSDLLDDPRLDWHAASFALEALRKMPVEDLDPEVVRRGLLNPTTQHGMIEMIEAGRYPAQKLGVDWLQAMAYAPDWERSEWVDRLRRERQWARHLSFYNAPTEQVLEWLADVRRFTPRDLGFDWLLRLAGSSDESAHDFAVEYMIKAFSPGDFAPAEAAAATAAPAAPTTVDLGGRSFLFTGKLATMTRDEAEKKVASAGGSNASSVSPKLDYLVIGDEGSSLYGQGKKGSKQVKAEGLVAKGAGIKIISETAFLRMLSGNVQEASPDTSMAGALRIWEMLTSPGPADRPLARFALQYIRRHHPDIALAETDRPVDPGAEIPAELLSFERVSELLWDQRQPLRELGIELSRWELARQAPSIDAIVRLTESPFPEVRAFAIEAVLADEKPEHARYRVDPARIDADAALRFAESLEPATRAVGMELLARHPRLATPENLFRLSESPDPRTRAFVIRTLWAQYRDRGISPKWRPAPPPASKLKKGAKVETVEAPAGPPPRPEQLPAAADAMTAFLRRVLFEIPPARPPVAVEGGPKLPRLPARRAKIGMIEVMRDLALEDPAFAATVLPLLNEFQQSRGPSENAAVLVARTRITHAWPALSGTEVR